jgi:hypothetical protein
LSQSSSGLFCSGTCCVQDECTCQQVFGACTLEQPQQSLTHLRCCPAAVAVCCPH